MVSNDNVDKNIIKNKKKFKCFICNKKSLIEFKCKCNNNFCLKHFSPENHKCIYDFKQDKINLEKCIAEKIDQIN